MFGPSSPFCRVKRSDQERTVTPEKTEEFQQPVKPQPRNGFTPSKYQQAIFDFIREGEGSAVIEARAGAAKCLGINTPILMFDGSIKSVQEVQVGDQLMGPDSKPRNVLNTNTGYGRMFNIQPIKGDSWICNDVHVLTLVNSVTNDIFDIPLNEYLKIGSYKKGPHHIADAKLFRTGVEFKEQKTNIEPYLLGLWIGDGSIAGPRISSPDIEIHEYLKDIAKKYNLTAKIRIKENKCPDIDLTGINGSKNKNIVREALKEAVINKEKTIPDIYLKNNRTNRLNLLAGILDTDGHLSKGYYTLVTKYDGLSDKILFLARSLGFAAYKKQIQGRIKSTGFIGLYWRINICGHIDEIPCLVRRKKANPRKQRKNVLRTGFKVNEIPENKYFGFTLDNDGRFLLGDFTVTHNTTTIVKSLEMIPYDKKVLFLAFNVSIKDEIQSRVPEHIKNNVKTLNGLGHMVWTRAMNGKVKLEKSKVRGIVHDMIPFGHRKYATPVTQLVDKAKNVGLLPAEYEGEFFGLHSDTKENWEDIADAFNIDLDEVVPEKAFEYAREVLKQNIAMRDIIDFTDQFYMPLIHNCNFPIFDFIFVDESQDLNSIQIEVLKRCYRPHTRIISVGDPRQCHPAGTMIEVTGKGKIPIEDLEVNTQLVTYHDCFRGIKTQGRKLLQKASRPYKGELLTLKVGCESVKVTPNHKIPARMKKNEKAKYALYLMESGKTSRIGICKTMYSMGIGPVGRMQHEKCDRGWILEVFENLTDAKIAETLTSLKFSLPESIFTGKKIEIKQQLIKAIGDNSQNAIACLKHFHRDYEFPLFEKNRNNKLGRYIAVVEACNLIENLHEMRAFNGTRDGGGWHLVGIEREQVDTEVFSLEVEPTEGGLHLYVADNILVHNCIYAWRGANPDSMDIIRRTFNAQTFSLPISYRCPLSTIKLAQILVPDIQAAPNAIEGEVLNLGGNYSFNDFGPEDVILCRTNAPIIKMAYKLLSSKIPCKVIGRDIGSQIISLIKKLDAADFKDLVQKVEEWKDKELLKENAKKVPTKIETIYDKYETIITLVTACKSRTIDELIGEIENMFADEKTRGILRLSTVHRFKGQEANRVFILNKYLMPSRHAKTPIAMQGEYNVIYVAITRAIKQLIYIDSDPTKKPSDDIELH